MDKDNKDNISVEERAALLMSLMRPPDQMPTRDAVEANKILNSLRINQPKSFPNGTLSIRNPVTNIQGAMTADSIFEGVTGKSAIEEFMPQAKRSIKDQSIPRPATLMMY